jgi:hypothetical protein
LFRAARTCSRSCDRSWPGSRRKPRTVTVRLLPSAGTSGNLILLPKLDVLRDYARGLAPQFRSRCARKYGKPWRTDMGCELAACWLRVPAARAMALIFAPGLSSARACNRPRKQTEKHGTFNTNVIILRAVPWLFTGSRGLKLSGVRSKRGASADTPQQP